ncbi:hypothetical protein GCM10009609_00160 [Pseudonocardia aurantiaca]
MFALAAPGVAAAASADGPAVATGTAGALPAQPPGTDPPPGNDPPPATDPPPGNDPPPATDPPTGNDPPGTNPPGSTPAPNPTQPRPGFPGFTRPPASPDPAQIAREQAEAAKHAEQVARELAEQAKHAEQAAREQAEAIQRAQELAAAQAEQAAAVQEARASWDSRGRPAKLAIVRADRVEVITEGRLVRNVPRTPGAVTFGALDRYLPDDWITVDGDTAFVDAMVVLSTGTNLQIDEDTKTIQLAGGPEPGDAASIFTGGGRLTLTGVTITSADRETKAPLPDTAAGRPFVEVSAGGRLNATDSGFSDLGSPAVGAGEGNAGLRFNTGSTGSLVRTTVQRNTIGLVLSASTDVRLEEVTVSESTGDGLVLSGDRGTTMDRVRAEGNGGNGVLVTGENSDRPITGFSTSGNGVYGLAVVGQTGARVTGIVTEGDKAGGLRLSRVTDVVVTDFTATEQPIGVFTHVNSSGVLIEGLSTTGGRRGLVVEKSTHGLELRASTIADARVAGVAIGGKEVRLTDVQVADSRAGVRVERGAGDVQLTKLTVEGGRDGIVASAGTTGVVVTDLVANNVGYDAVRSASPGAQIVGGTINGGATGIDVAAAATIVGTTIAGSNEGIHSRSPELVHADKVQVDATDVGVNALPGSPFRLSNSSVHALEALRGVIEQQGVNDFSLPPLNILGAIGVPLILLALVLEQVHAFRQRRFGGTRRRHLPPIPVGGG